MRHAFARQHGLVRIGSVTLAMFALTACGGGFSAGSDSSSGGTGGASEHGQAGSTNAAGTASGSAGSNNGGSSSGGSSSTAGMSSGGNAGGVAVGGAGGTPTTGGTGGGPASQCPCSAPTPTCEVGRCISRGPSMIKAEGFYIDSTEVTSGQYAIFEKAKGDDTSGQAAECSWNNSYDPELDPVAPLPTAKHPVTNVDFCDAAAYCAWADKRLCGKIGGGSLQFAELADPSKSQWFEACSGKNGQLYSYGPAYQAEICNDSSGAGALVDVASKAKCMGVYPALFDMLGNAREWVDACDANAGEKDGCETIGGSYLDATSCGQSGLQTRSQPAPELGFRCCSK